MFRVYLCYAVCLVSYLQPSFVDHVFFFVSCVSHAFATVHSCLVVTGWERADLLALVGGVYCIFCSFPCGILGQVWYLIVSLLDLCLLPISYDHLLEKA